MKFSVFCLWAAIVAEQGAAVRIEQAAQNTPAINIIDNARIMMLPGSVPGMGCGCTMAQMFSEKSDEVDAVLAQKDDLDNDEELLSQVSSSVGLDTDALLATFKEEAGMERDDVLAQLRMADNATELAQLSSV